MYSAEQKDDCGFALGRFSGEGLRWDKSKFPISFYIHQSVPAPAARNFVSAVDHWNMAWERYLSAQGLSPFPLFAVPDKNTRYSGSPKNDGYNIFLFAEDYSKYGSLDQQAITSVYSSTSGEIKDTDIIVNNHVVLNGQRTFYFYDESYNDEIVLSQREVKESRKLASLQMESSWLYQLKQKIWLWLKFFLKPFQKKKPLRQLASPSARVPIDKMDFASLMIHELGHVPGMGHFDRSDQIHREGRLASRGRRGRSKRGFISVMERKLTNGRARRAVGEHDLDNLFCGYFNY